jgi:hypothetical protein
MKNVYSLRTMGAGMATARSPEEHSPHTAKGTAPVDNIITMIIIESYPTFLPLSPHEKRTSRDFLRGRSREVRIHRAIFDEAVVVRYAYIARFSPLVWQAAADLVSNILAQILAE